jgi:hypothetical protein
LSYIEDITPTLILPPQGGGDVEVDIASPRLLRGRLAFLAMTKYFNNNRNVKMKNLKIEKDLELEELILKAKKRRN